MFALVHQNVNLLQQLSSISLPLEDGVLHSVEQNSKNSAIALDTVTEFLSQLLGNVLQGKAAHSFNIKSVQLLLSNAPNVSNLHSGEFTKAGQPAFSQFCYVQ
ncbi:hypothetical protein NPIL_87551 [Nephila pilipes]|uniref:Uncharacterized protein n=1 Tax=Nephila pilipes TaxID=299642 RepID=A0A8X6QZN8_NEPPI|nr:hypothetical protein NPIL_87551 [Nephila pilipes]